MRIVVVAMRTRAAFDIFFLLSFFSLLFFSLSFFSLSFFSFFLYIHKLTLRSIQLIVHVLRFEGF